MPVWSTHAHVLHTMKMHNHGLHKYTSYCDNTHTYTYTSQLYFRNPSPHFIPCSELMHQGSCHMCALNDFYNGCILYFKIYLTLYSLPLVLFRTSKLFKNTKESIVTLLQNASVSALFFAVDATVVKYGLCLLRNVWGRPPPVPYFIPLLAGLLGSLGLLIERESRRRELLYYVLPQVCGSRERKKNYYIFQFLSFRCFIHFGSCFASRSLSGCTNFHTSPY